MKMFLQRKWLLITGCVLLISIGAGWYFSLTQNSSEAQSFKFGQIERGPLNAVVAASGTLNPVAQVQVGTQISGQLKEVLADFNTEVKHGQIIARLDPETYELKVRQAQADLEAAQAQVLTQQSNALAQQAEIGRIQVGVLDAERDFERKDALVKQGFISAADRDKAQATLHALREQLKTAEAQLHVARAQTTQAQAALMQRRAALASAQVDLGRTIIRAPVDGVIVKRSVEPGQTVAASLQAPELFIIARNLHDMQVETAIDEADVGRIHTEQAATFTVDAFPGRTFSGTVRQVRKAALNVQNVITYTVVIATQNPQQILLPGMTANVRIVTDKRQDALKVPNAALRFRPPSSFDSGTDKNESAKKIGKTAEKTPGTGSERGQAERTQLIQELQLSTPQQQQLDSIFAKQRERLQALRDLPEAERGKVSERARAETRSAIRALLTAEQQQKYDELNVEQSGRGSSKRGRVYVLEQGKLKAINLALGISDGMYTEVLSNTVKESDAVVVGLLNIKDKKNSARSPF